MEIRRSCMCSPRASMDNLEGHHGDVYRCPRPTGRLQGQGPGQAVNLEAEEGSAFLPGPGRATQGPSHRDPVDPDHRKRLSSVL